MFKTIPGFPDYTINEDGEIMSYRRYPEGKLKKTDVNNNGYFMVSICKDVCDEAHKLVHRLVAETFIPNPDNLPEVNHIDKNKTNNNVDNLEWSTRIDNAAHSLSKYYTLLELATGNVFPVFNLAKWCKDNHKHQSPLTRTYYDPIRHKSCQGYKVIAINENAPDVNQGQEMRRISFSTHTIF